MIGDFFYVVERIVRVVESSRYNSLDGLVISALMKIVKEQMLKAECEHLVQKEKLLT